MFALQGYAVPDHVDGRALPGATSAVARDVVFSEYGCGGPRYRLADHARRVQRHGEAALLDTLLEREYEGARAMVTDGSWKLIHDPTGDEDEMYDLATDPWELCNLARRPQHAERADSLRARVTGWRAAR
jgi:arylsulfatase A-like enzyme